MIGPAGQRVARNLRRLRITRRLSLRELSDATRERGHYVSAACIARIENGRGTLPAPINARRIDIDELLVLAACLQVNPADLWTDPGDCELCFKELPSGFTCEACSRRGAPPTT